MSNDWTDHDTLVAYLRGRLPEEETRRLEARLSHDAALRAELDGARRVLEVVDAASDERIARWANAMLDRAVAERASDLHLDLTATGGTVRLRFDGVLHEIESLPPEAARAGLARFRQMLGMAPENQTLPADGRLLVTAGEREVVVAGSFLPGLHGGRFCARLLDRAAALPDWSRLGLFADEEAAVDRLLHQPNGLILTCGPTGSGKTTMLYALVQRLAQPGINVMSVEDPIEYDLPGVAQTAVGDDPRLSYAALLRAVMRQDPDVVMVGELHEEALDGCLNLALTGHLVLTQLHAGDAVSAVARLVDLGADRALLAESLLGIISMRLVRRICRQCRQAGCEACRGTGYHGRQAVYEVFEVTPPVREAIRSGAPGAALAELAFGAQPDLRRHGAELVRQGVTSEAELRRVLESGDTRPIS